MLNRDLAIQRILDKKYITDGSINDSVDGSGLTPSVNENNAPHIISYIIEQMPYINWPEVRALDVGCGKGYFTKYLNDIRIKCVGAEGSLNLESDFVDPENTVIWDFTKEFGSLGEISDVLNDTLFDVSFSFEVIEHVDPYDQGIFWDNIISLSDYHVCSIHVENGRNEYHKTMISEQEWVEFFNKNNIEIVKHIPRKEWIDKVTPWECSCFFILKF